jgi:phosphatidylglycerophosphate synthase
MARCGRSVDPAVQVIQALESFNHLCGEPPFSFPTLSPFQKLAASLSAVPPCPWVVYSRYGILRVFGVAGLLDLIDGWLARRLNQ